ncbi:MAG: polyphosphate kinase 1 [Bacteroidetes bacterium]|nr:polyphosphate kinase 1 [Bacteroidota bacterium]MBT6836872.1 polyphosphate kinase 1 [Bacteroidota bacterium]MBT7038371.1 polyphosphate kinase 1 [Bacteroidota bacterium]MBT7996625.1 polyphosphate kinase 1 [Bacteroidota bacterium]
MTDNYRNKEISWLHFNERVLQEAECEDVPLLERIRFLGIFSNNQDEFFRVRVATLRRISILGKKLTTVTGEEPAHILKEIQQIVLNQGLRFDTIYSNIRKKLEEEQVFIINEKQLDTEQGEYVRDYFIKEVRPKLIPIMLGQSEEFPYLKDDAIYLAVSLFKRETEKLKFAVIQIPSDILPRFLILPEKNGNKYIILLDDIIRFELRDIFYIFDYDEVTAHTIKLTKDAELDISDDLSESTLRKISKSLSKRKLGEPVRFVYDAKIPDELLNYLVANLNLGRVDAMIPGGRYHNFKDFMDFPLLGKAYRYEALPPLVHPDISYQTGMLRAIRERDIMLYFPYHSFDTFIDLLREASIDPKVEEIKITLYRLAKNSSVINALINAARNGKTVTAVVELQARFDEEANIYWSSRLKEEGVKVIYGVNDLKVHSKLCLITRKERSALNYYACIGTGNFNEDTTSIFSDLMLLTFDKRITMEVSQVFEFFEKNYKIGSFKHLMLAPFFFREKLNSLIDTEIRNAKKGQKACIHFKLNNLVDDEIILKLYEAAEAGVEVKLNIRGMFSLLPDQKENIDAIGIIDRYLEHARIFLFCNNGKEKLFIGSPDLMKRNMDYRVEVVCPIYDKQTKDNIKAMIDIQWRDNVKARILDNNFKNELKVTDDKDIRSQVEFYNYLKTRSKRKRTNS